METIIIKLRDKIGSLDVEVGVNLLLPLGQNAQEYLSAEFDKTLEVLKRKKEQHLNLQEVKNNVMANSDKPICPACKIPMKISSTGKRWICVNSSFKTINGKLVNSGCQEYMPRK